MPALKTLTYALMHFTVAFAVAYALTGSLAAAASIGLVEPLVQTAFYNVHERLWAKHSMSGATSDPLQSSMVMP